MVQDNYVHHDNDVRLRSCIPLLRALTCCNVAIFHRLLAGEVDSL